ncbi:MAG: hypothetical protein ABSD20_02865 [Terriglobales bacterium]|jgi:hypothetical protein
MKPGDNSSRRILTGGMLIGALCLQPGGAKAQQGPVAAGERAVVAIDMALEPDATLLQQAHAANAGLMKNFHSFELKR